MRQAREAAGLSLRGLAFSGCTAPYLSAIEHGRRVPSLQILEALADRLGVRVGWLARGVEIDEDALLVDAELALRLGELAAAEQQLLPLSREPTRPAQRARALAGLGEIRFHQGEIPTAIEQFEAAFALAGEQMMVPLATAAELLGRCYALRGELESALALFERSRRQAQQAGERVLALRFTVLLANAYVDIGDLAGSAATIAAALVDAQQLADPLLRARVYWTQSRLHTVEGRHDLAAEFAAHALATFQAVDDEHAVARAQQMLAYIETERHNPEQALALLAAAEPAMARLAGPLEHASFELERARALVALDQTEQAQQIALTVAPILLANAKHDSGRCFIVLADIFDAAGDHDAALNLLDAAIDALADHRNPHLARAYQTKASILENLGRTNEALELLKSALALQTPSVAREPIDQQTARPRSSSPSPS